jgi:hypothetical protein
MIEAMAGEAARNVRLTIEAGSQIDLPIYLEAGVLHLSSSLTGPKRRDPTHVNFTIKPLSSPPPQIMRLIDGHVVKERLPLPERSFRRHFILPAGKYDIQAMAGNSNARAETVVTIEPGGENEKTISLKAGHVKLAMLLEKGDQPLPGVFWSIFDQSGHQVASASRASPELTLAGGKYRIVAEYLGKSMERMVTLAAGASKKIEFILQ